MDTQIFNNFVTYMGVYECLSRGPCTPNEVAKYLTNSMTSRNAAKHSKKAADGDLNDKLINTSYHSGSFFINNPKVWGIRVLLVPVDCVACQMLPIHLLVMKYGLDFPAGISYIPLIHNVKKRGKFVTAIV